MPSVLRKICSPSFVITVLLLLIIIVSKCNATDEVEAKDLSTDEATSRRSTAVAGKDCNYSSKSETSA